MNYLQQLANDIKAQLSDDRLPDGDTDALFLLYAVLLDAKGVDVTNQDVHDAWVAWMTKVDPDHESLVPYAELSADTKGEDSPFVSAIRAVATNRA